jgi:hypothetical protein
MYVMKKGLVISSLPNVDVNTTYDETTNDLISVEISLSGNLTGKYNDFAFDIPIDYTMTITGDDLDNLISDASSNTVVFEYTHGLFNDSEYGSVFEMSPGYTHFGPYIKYGDTIAFCPVFFYDGKTDSPKDVSYELSYLPFNVPDGFAFDGKVINKLSINVDIITRTLTVFDTYSRAIPIFLHTYELYDIVVDYDYDTDTIVNAIHKICNPKDTSSQFSYLVLDSLDIDFPFSYPETMTIIDKSDGSNVDHSDLYSYDGYLTFPTDNTYQIKLTNGNSFGMIIQPSSDVNSGLMFIGQSAYSDDNNVTFAYDYDNKNFVVYVGDSGPITSRMYDLTPLSLHFIWTYFYIIGSVGIVGLVVNGQNVLHLVSSDLYDLMTSPDATYLINPNVDVGATFSPFSGNLHLLFVGDIVYSSEQLVSIDMLCHLTRDSIQYIVM